MGFGGSVAGMIVSLKNNKRNRKSAFEKLDRFQKENSDTLHFKNSATQEELEAIKSCIKKENNVLLIKNILLFVIALAILYCAISFINF